MEARIDELLSQLTLEEKVSLLAGADMWHTVPVERVGIPVMKVSDGPNGVRGSDDNRGLSSTSFPVGVAMGATWNPELIEKVGGVLAEETKDKGAHVLLAPTVNIQRSPLAGRNFEVYSEDPYLSGRMATAYIRGLQAGGVAACIKHFVCNDSEYERFSMSSEVRERTLREIYLTPFRMALRDAQPWTVMSAYNRVNGRYASANSYLLRDILKGEWGFDGIVISDWYGTYGPDVAAGGLDLEMPGPARWMGEPVLEQLRSGELSEAEVDDKVRRILRTMERVGLFEEPELQPEQAVDTPERRALAREVARQAIVLLKNEGDLLPLQPEKLTSIAVIGENARWTQFQGGGSSQVTPHYVVSPLEGIRARAGDGVEVAYAFGAPMHKYMPLCDSSFLSTKEGEAGLRVDYFGNRQLEGEPVHSDVVPEAELSWFGERQAHVDPDDFSVRLSGILTPSESGAYRLGLLVVGQGRLYLGEELLIDGWESPAAEGELIATAELEAGQAYSLTIEYAVQPGSRWRTVRLGCLPAMGDDPIGAAAEAARQADVAIVLAGLTDEWEGEGADRADMSLPGKQEELIRRVAAANPNTVVVLNAGSPLEMPWLEEVPSLLQLWYAGQETGNALADVLFGDVDASGRLPTTFPRRLQDNPAYINYPGENGKVYYGEGLFVGYRYYDEKEIEPLFPFGYGLSYTSFAYHEMNVDQETYGPGDTIEVQVEIENTGQQAGSEVIQLYLRDVQSSLKRPQKELKGFAKVSLAAGEQRTVTLTLEPEALAFYDPARGRWVTEAGDFELLAGRSAADIQLRRRFHWRGEAEAAAGEGQALHTGLMLKQLLDDPHGRAVLEQHLGELMQHPQAEMALNMTLDQLGQLVPQLLPAETLRAINEDLAKGVEG